MKAKQDEFFLQGNESCCGDKTLDLAQAELERGQLLFRTTQYTEALRCFYDACFFLEEKNLRFNDETYSAYYWLSKTLFLKGDKEKAIAAARTATRIGYVLGFLEDESLWKMSGWTEERLEHEHNGLMASVARERKGDCLCGSAAIVEYLQAIELEERYVAVSLDLCVLWRKIALVANKKSIEDACELDSKCLPMTAIQLGDFLRREMAYAEAISEYRKAALGFTFLNDTDIEDSSSNSSEGTWYPNSISGKWWIRGLGVVAILLVLLLIVIQMNWLGQKKQEPEPKLHKWEVPYPGLLSGDLKLADETYWVVVDVVDKIQGQIRKTISVDSWLPYLESEVVERLRICPSTPPATLVSYNNFTMTMMAIGATMVAVAVGFWWAKRSDLPTNQNKVTLQLERLRRLMISGKEEAFAEFRRIIAHEELMLEDLRHGFAKLLTA